MDALGQWRRLPLAGDPVPATVSVEVERGDGSTYVPSGWFYDESTGTVAFAGEVPKAGETVVVRYAEAC